MTHAAMTATGNACLLAMLRWFKPETLADHAMIREAKSALSPHAGDAGNVLRTLPKTVSPHIRIRVLYCVGRTLLIRAGEGAWDTAWQVIEPLWRALEGDSLTRAEADLSVEIQDRAYSMLGVEHMGDLV